MRYIVFTLIITLIACSNFTENVKKQANEEVKIIESDNLDTSLCISRSFDIPNYKLKIDSLISRIIGENIQTKIACDTLNREDVVFIVLKNNPLENLSRENEVIKCTFSLTGIHSGLKHHLIILSSGDEIKADSVFSIFERVALEKSGVPGLTYTSDYVVRISDKIYWLNSNCPYSYNNHMKFVEIFKKMKNIKEIKAIECECGKIRCVTSER